MAQRFPFPRHAGFVCFVLFVVKGVPLLTTKGTKGEERDPARGRYVNELFLLSAAALRPTKDLAFAQMCDMRNDGLASSDCQSQRIRPPSSKRQKASLSQRRRGPKAMEIGSFEMLGVPAG